MTFKIVETAAVSVGDSIWFVGGDQPRIASPEGAIGIVASDIAGALNACVVLDFVLRGFVVALNLWRVKATALLTGAQQQAA